MIETHNRSRRQGLRAFAILLAVAGRAWSAESGTLQKDIDALFENEGGKIHWQERIDRAAAHGAEAVSILIARSHENEPALAWVVPRTLCQIPTPESLDFLTGLLQKHEDENAAREILRSFPVDQEDRITPLLITLLEVPRLSGCADSRLREMISRKPARAGELVASMDTSVTSMTGKNWVIGEVLAAVSGYTHTWCCDGRPNVNWGQWQREFWKEWWKRNKDRNQIEWLVETYQSAAENPNRQSQAMQMLASLRNSQPPAFFVAALDSKSEEVRYWAVAGLLRVEAPQGGGYAWETFQKEQAQVIARLKKKYSAGKGP